MSKRLKLSLVLFDLFVLGNTIVTWMGVPHSRLLGGNPKDDVIDHALFELDALNMVLVAFSVAALVAIARHSKAAFIFVALFVFHIFYLSLIHPLVAIYNDLFKVDILLHFPLDVYVGAVSSLVLLMWMTVDNPFLRKRVETSAHG